MNKKELVKALMKQMQKFGYFPSFTNVKTFIQEYEKLTKPKPQKPVVPQFVADWIERSKQEKRNIRNALNNGGEKMRLWFLDLENYDIFVRAWLDGYQTIEEEKRYLVKMKNVSPECECLYWGMISKTWLFKAEDIYGEFRKHHTRKELENAGFGWVFDCEGVEIEEVE